MKKYDVESCEILRKEQLTEDIFDVTVRSQMAKAAVPGQFAHIFVPGKTLRRPISICEIGEETLRFVFQIRGDGTRILAESRVGDFWDILVPLGNGFTLGDLSRKVCFVGGGIGVPPLLEAAKRFGRNATVITGFRNAGAVILQEDFKRAGCGLILTTDDGSAGGLPGNLCLRPDPYAEGAPGGGGKARHSLPDFSGGTDGLRRRGLPRLCLQAQSGYGIRMEIRACV